MKGTDIALIIFVALISTGISFWVGNMVLGNPDDRTETISYMDVITDSLNEPDNEYFNPKAKNPTVEVFIGKCESGKCCSKYGWCGTGPNYCNVSNGCQSEFG